MATCELTWYDPSSSAPIEGGPNYADGGAWHPGDFVCAAPPAFAFGTKIQFSWHGKSVTCVVRDRGGAIQGTHFDLTPDPANALGMKDAGAVFDASFAVVDSKTPTGGGGSSGGTAGLGGTGTTPGATKAQSAFQIGDTSNPDEDYWTALNRLGQDAYWYVFSDGIWLYIADGYQIMLQPPVRTINRFDPNVLHMEGTWDNTTWQFAAHHKRRGKIQRKSTLAKVSSPTQITVDLICKIDDVRAGQVVQVLGMGPLDGNWLIGDCRRPVFQVFSSLTLVPALTPIPAAQATTGASGSSSSSASTGPGGYVNPFGKIGSGLSWEGVDQGVDFNAPSGSPISAIGNATINLAQSSGSGFRSPMNTQAGVFYTLNDGSQKGNQIYVTEDFTPTVISGQTVKAGDTIGTFLSSGTGIETGYAQGNGPLAPLTGSPTAAGASFNRFLLSLGAPGQQESGSGGPVPPNAP